MGNPIFYYGVKQHFFDPENRWNFQTNEQWLKLRKGKITASNADALFTDPREKSKKDAGELSATMKAIVDATIMESITDWVDDRSVAYSEKEALYRGLVYEQEAREWYENTYGIKLKECGFVENGNIGCSPDALFWDESELLQIKIPMPYNFLKELESAEQGKHSNQCLFELKVCEKKRNTLLVYSPELKTGKCFIVDADKDWSAECDERLSNVDAYKAEKMQELKKLGWK